MSRDELLRYNFLTTCWFIFEYENLDFKSYDILIPSFGKDELLLRQFLCYAML